MERAARVAFVVDGEAYYRAAKSAMSKARRSILLVGWDFDPRVELERGSPAEWESSGINKLLGDLVAERPDLQVHILIWDMTRLIALSREVSPQGAQRWLPSERVHYRVDAEHPNGASHHQKILVVDDAVAFCGGADFAHNRWDTVEHRDDEPGRRSPGGVVYKPRHDVMMVVDGAAAAALGELARERWYRAAGWRPAVPAPGGDCWPDTVAPEITDVGVGIARTQPPLGDRPEVGEVEALHLASIAAAGRWIFLENQYFASEVIGEALATRLTEPDGPEILVVSAFRSPGFSDHLTMDSARHLILRRLRQADRYRRFRAYAPVTAAGKPVIVHSKIAIIDDRLVRVGSANLNNRSMGLDTECDLAIEVEPGDASSAGIRAFLCRLLAEHMASGEGEVAALLEREDSLIAVVDAANPASGRRLVPLDPARPGLLEALIGRNHLLDPLGVEDNWRPWQRRSAFLRRSWRPPRKTLSGKTGVT